MSSRRPSFDDIAARLGMADSGLDPRGQRRALTLLRTLAEGEPVPPARLGERAGLPTGEAAAFIDALTGAYRDDAGDVIGFWGLTAAEMPRTATAYVGGTCSRGARGTRGVTT